jgi:two-component system, OmpR family, response regulator AdeR
MNCASPLVLIVEDEPNIAQVLEKFLHREHFRTEIAKDGSSALKLHRAAKPEIVLLDVKLPDLDGFEVLKQLRQTSDTPVIMVTAMGEDLDKLLGLTLGADDYILKPFSPLEVVARVKSVLRRAATQPKSDAPIRVGKLELDCSGMAAKIDSQRLDLTLTEFRLLEHLARHPNRAFSRAELIDAVIPESDALERVMNAHMSNLRLKLAQVGAETMLETVRGVGYKLAI